MSTSTTMAITRPPGAVAEISLPSQIDQLDRHGYLFGKKLAASMSPFLHDIIYRELSLRWAQIRLDSSDIDHFLQLTRHPKFYGASVTMPNKVAILPYLDDMTDECREVGACNTIFLREDPSGRRLLVGANTDVIGVRESFFQNIPSRDIWECRPGLIIGGGGAARSAIYALRKWFRVSDIYLINRDEGEIRDVEEECRTKGFGDGLIHIKDVEQAKALGAPGAIVACIPDLPPTTEEEKQTRQLIEIMLGKERKGAMLEMCYNPSPYTELGALAEKEGWQVILGTQALIWQGLEQDKYWTGRDNSDLPVKTVQEAVAARLAQHAKQSQ